MPSSNLLDTPVRPALPRMPSAYANMPASPVTAPPMSDHEKAYLDGILELIDGTAYRGFSFGAEGKSIAGECVFQTGKSNHRT